MAKQILIIRTPIDFKGGNIEELSDFISSEYFVIVLYDEHVEDLQFEYPKNCDLPVSDLEKIREAITVK